MSNMRQRLLTMTRRVQERPCWIQDDILLDENMNHTSEQLVNLYFQQSDLIYFSFIEIRK
jgi:hypothetical protein